MFGSIVCGLERLRQTVRKFGRNRQGAVSVLFGFSIVAVIGFLGLATDAGRGYIAKARLGQAVDAAALAGGKVIHLPYRDAEIQKYFAANFPDDYMGSVVVDFDIEVGEGNEQLTISATARIPTTFMRVLHIDDMKVSARSVVKRSVRGLELALIMDNTGSMRSSAKIETMKAAATDLVNILYGEKEEINNFWVGLIPFVATVNVGPQHADWLTADPTDPTTTELRVLATGGTPIGDMTRAGGLAAAFDGDSHQTHRLGAYQKQKKRKRTSEIGKDWGEGNENTIVGYRITSSSNRGFVRIRERSKVKVDFFFEGSDDGIAWTRLHFKRVKYKKRKQNRKYIVDITDGIDVSKPYRFHRIRIRDKHQHISKMYVAELEMYTEAEVPIPTVWKGCVEARTSPLDESDAPPSEELFIRHYWRSTINDYDEEDGDNDWPEIDETNEAQNEGTGPNLGCGPAITSLTAEKSKVLAAIDEMQPWHRGGTHANLGLAWGWRVISPRWRGLWGGDTPDNLPMDYDAPLMDKAAIVLTDGQNVYYDWPGGLPGRPLSGSFPDTDYTAYGRLSEGRLGTTNQAAAVVEINNRMSRLCENMKDEGIVIYAITFRLNDVPTQNLMRNCASDPDKYYNSPSNDELRAAFVAIGNELTNLRIAE